MGTTVVALLVREQRYAVLWVGDSRAYLLRDGKLVQLSRDHTQVQEMVDRGIMRARGRGRPSDGPYPVARGRRARGGRRSTGRPARSSPATSSCSASDGLHGYVDEAEIRRLLGRGSPERALDALIALTLENGAPDNVTGDRGLGQRAHPPLLRRAGEIMSDDKDKTPPEEERTVFAPGGEPPPPPAEPAAPPPPAAPPRADRADLRRPRAGDAVGIKVGDVLNHIFEVKRFLARGGMGEVFEGCNVNTDEKVAIKVMLPALASDEKVIAMFRKEARTLTKLHHPALVQYRVLAQEPQLHVLYIVTDFIEGTNLSDALGEADRSPDELAGLLRRLAAGLGAAHQLGAVHRDMSPDNVILEE